MFLEMDGIEWSGKKRRSTNSRRISIFNIEGSRRSIDKEVLVYHRRSVHEREEATERRRDTEDLHGLGQLSKERTHK
jgi:hypothetical protein